MNTEQATANTSTAAPAFRFNAVTGEGQVSICIASTADQGGALYLTPAEARALLGELEQYLKQQP